MGGQGTGETVVPSSPSERDSVKRILTSGIAREFISHLPPGYLVLSFGVFFIQTDKLNLELETVSVSLVLINISFFWMNDCVIVPILSSLIGP